jgi:Zn ribbon nucleic-acid-binding protein
LNEDQRRAALAALTAAEGVGPKAAMLTAAPKDKALKARRRPDALGVTGHERVESRGCPHCAGREIMAWGRSRGLARFRCKSCGRTFNALSKSPMAHLRKKERWLDHAQR